ncbi:hypothetical protein HKX48_007680 [Thoreauomyces humboldtii]|nr:hypothetical protein HKX48_007680 [Thoreauomyces humboldtii]
MHRYRLCMGQEHRIRTSLHGCTAAKLSANTTSISSENKEVSKRMIIRMDLTSHCPAPKRKYMKANARVPSECCRASCSFKGSGDVKKAMDLLVSLRVKDKAAHKHHLLLIEELRAKNAKEKLKLDAQITRIYSELKTKMDGGPFPRRWSDVQMLEISLKGARASLEVMEKRLTRSEGRVATLEETLETTRTTLDLMERSQQAARSTMSNMEKLLESRSPLNADESLSSNTTKVRALSEQSAPAPSALNDPASHELNCVTVPESPSPVIAPVPESDRLTLEADGLVKDIIASATDAGILPYTRDPIHIYVIDDAQVANKFLDIVSQHSGYKLRLIGLDCETANRTKTKSYHGPPSMVQVAFANDLVVIFQVGNSMKPSPFASTS